MYWHNFVHPELYLSWLWLLVIRAAEVHFHDCMGQSLGIYTLATITRYLWVQGQVRFLTFTLTFAYPLRFGLFAL